MHLWRSSLIGILSLLTLACQPDDKGGTDTSETGETGSIAPLLKAPLPTTRWRRTNTSSTPSGW